MSTLLSYSDLRDEGEDDGSRRKMRWKWGWRQGKALAMSGKVK